MSLPVLIAISAAVCSVGFRRFVHFLSVGYAFAVAALAVALAVAYASLSWPVALAALAALAAYALRLGVFLVAREAKSGAYRKVLGSATEGLERVPLPVKGVVWACCSVLYVMQVSPLYFRLANGRGDDDAPWLLAGLAVMAIGIVLQAVADSQKSRSKRRNPSAFCRDGLFAVVRCPNYFGEILVWTGVLISSITCLQGWFQYAFALAGYAGIVYVMFGSARRLELRQEAAYGADPAYREYVSRVPVLLPCLPLYSIASWTWLVV